MFEHVGDDSSKQLATDFKTRVGVDLDEPDIEILINHEIQTEYLEVVLQIVGI